MAGSKIPLKLDTSTSPATEREFAADEYVPAANVDPAIAGLVTTEAATRAAADVALQAAIDAQPVADVGRQIDSKTVDGAVRFVYRAPRLVKPRPSVRAWSSSIEGVNAGVTATAPPEHGPYLVGDAADLVAINGSLQLVRDAGSGSFISEGFVVGSVCPMTGWINGGNNATKTIATVDHRLITFTSTSGLVAEDADVSGATVAMTSYTQHMHPFTCATRIDARGYPHHCFRALEANLSNGSTPSMPWRGYEDGDFVGKGRLKNGMGFAYDMTFDFWNTVNADAMFEFVIEPNASCAPVGVFDGANRMRFKSGEIGSTWSGARLLQAHLEVLVEGRKKYRWRGAFEMFNASGDLVWTLPVADSTDNGFDWLTTDAIVNPRVRVDRIANVDTYDTTYQGLTSLKLLGRKMSFKPIGEVA